MQEEREILKSQIEELKTRCENETAERNANEVKLAQKTENVNKLNK